jgi:pimeloyl-ACP methyl ester carboxylesterase
LGYLRARTYRSMPEALAAMLQTNVRLDRDIIVVEPRGDVLASLVFYQGGLVETEAYAVLAQLLADQGVRVFLPRMPLQLSILNTKVFDKIYEEYYDDGKWYIGGHSLGGAAAALYAASRHDRVSGLLLLGAYPANSSDLSALTLPVLSITASKDQIMDRQRFAATQVLLPKDATFVEIEGGNHANFGYYGTQNGDGSETISREEQHRRTVKLLINFIEGGGR